VFNLYFPVAEESAVETLAPAAQHLGHGQHILYVDDEQPLVLLITRTLKRMGYEVTGFSDPMEALHALRQQPARFQALVTDLSMPQMSGTDLAQEALQICPGLPVIVTSGYIRPQDQEIARKLGVREMILKPDTVEELGDALHRQLASVDVPPITRRRSARSGA
jgi:CheY-like chemotaxis protein